MYNFRELEKNGDTSYQEHYEKLRRKAVLVSVASLVLNAMLAMAAFVCTLLRNSASTSAFAADCALDGVSSMIVFWRYYGSHRNMYMHAKEQVACIYLGILFVISGAAVIGKASADIITQALPSSIDLMLYFASASLVICSGLSVAKFWLYRRMRSDSMLLDAINTLISAVFALVMIGFSLMIDGNVSLWYLDPVASIFLSLTMIIYGIKCIYDNFPSNNPRNGYIQVP
ncbi:putative transmembrane protein [Halotydeus destructor]|nr:putative transmembrane protein [Halotydeus destructor]